MNSEEPGQVPAHLDMTDWSEQERAWHDFDARQGKANDDPAEPERTRFGKVVDALGSIFASNRQED
jgi:hypothetical protein